MQEATTTTQPLAVTIMVEMVEMVETPTPEEMPILEATQRQQVSFNRANNPTPCSGGERRLNLRMPQHHRAALHSILSSHADYQGTFADFHL